MRKLSCPSHHGCFVVLRHRREPCRFLHRACRSASGTAAVKDCCGFRAEWLRLLRIALGFRPAGGRHEPIRFAADRHRPHRSGPGEPDDLPADLTLRGSPRWPEAAMTWWTPHSRQYSWGCSARAQTTVPRARPNPWGPSARTIQASCGVIA
jgi:hypothetical protein